jgi:hypothetical protein
VPVLEVKIASPLYSAVMVCVPTDKDDQIKGALPLDKTTALPMLIPSTLNCTDPVGVPDPGGTALTVALNVTICPTTDGLGNAVRVVVVSASFTVCVSVQVLPSNTGSPP